MIGTRKGQRYIIKKVIGDCLLWIGGELTIVLAALLPF